MKFGKNRTMSGASQAYLRHSRREKKYGKGAGDAIFSSGEAKSHQKKMRARKLVPRSEKRQEFRRQKATKKYMSESRKLIHWLNEGLSQAARQYRHSTRASYRPGLSTQGVRKHGSHAERARQQMDVRADRTRTKFRDSRKYQALQAKRGTRRAFKRFQKEHKFGTN